MATLSVQRVCGEAVLPYLDDVARLRIEVFREYPYLYDGDASYEARYLATYAASPEALFVLVFDGERVVGAATGVPMADETAEFKEPFLAHGLDPERIFYFGESVLDRAYRGQGLGVRFFTEREGYARELDRFSWCAFCAVDRPAGHPLRPPGHVDLDGFWNHRGYTRHPELRTTYTWKEVCEDAPSPKQMTFWLKSLAPLEPAP